MLLDLHKLLKTDSRGAVAVLDAPITTTGAFATHVVDAPGPFTGKAAVGDGADAAFVFDASIVSRVRITPGEATIFLSIESPVAGYCSVDALTFELRFVSNGSRWVARSPGIGWFDGTPQIEGGLDDWLNTPPRQGMKLKTQGPHFGRLTGFPLDLLGIAKGPNFWTRDPHDHVGWIGLLPASHPLVVFIAAGEFHGFDAEASTGIKLKGLTATALGDASKWAVMPVALGRRLDAGGDLGRWRAVVQWAPLWPAGDDGSHTRRLKLDPFLTRIWNEPVRHAMRGAHFERSAQPTFSLPLLKWTIDEPDGTAASLYPLLVFDVPPGRFDAQTAQANLRHVLLGGSAQNAVTASFNWQTGDLGFSTNASIADPDPAPDVLKDSALVFKGSPSGPNIEGWNGRPSGDDGVAIHATKYAELIDTACQPLDDLGRADLLLDLALTGRINPDLAVPARVLWGYLEIEVSPGTVASLDCKLRGRWSERECNLYPESDLTMDGCVVRVSASADLAGKDLHAMFDTVDLVEDALQRTTDPLRHPRTKNDPGRRCKVRIRHKTQPGRNAVTRVDVFSTDTDRSFGVESLHLQMRPFIAAMVKPSSIDNEAGELIAVWSSDDPEGAQWRVPDATVELMLPPQAVGEAMERGVRFWQSGPTPFIDPSHVLPYRFSPPTRLTVRPSLRDRRYNTNPGNLLAVFQEAKVESFVTEIAYPIETSFATSEFGLPDIHVRETASFLGQPAPNLPLLSEPTPNDIARLHELEALLADDAAYFAYRRIDLSTPSWSAFSRGLTDLRARQAANRASFVARVAMFHLSDPRRSDGGLGLAEGLGFRIRDTRSGAKPLLNPLPRWRLDYNAPDTAKKIPFTPVENPVDLAVAQKTEIHDPKNPRAPEFLKTNGPDTLWGDASDGAIPAGVIHTIEFPSELVAILRNPESKSGSIESLAFGALGATGDFRCAFDEGRTTFIAQTRDGQLSRLVKIRIGRLAVLWNKARHVIVYERTTVPSEQFQDEQELGRDRDDPAGEGDSRGWPILRKTEEYVEPIEVIRRFADEPQKDAGSAGYVNASEFVSPRIYVNGAWGRDLGHGYELPLWNRKDTSGFYPKPLMALLTHASGPDLSRCWHDEPENLYFYSNTQPDTGSDPDRWAPNVGVDGPSALARLPVVTNRGIVVNDLLASDAMPAPRLGGTRRPRFDFAVKGDGKVNLQHTRGATEMLASVDVVSMGRIADTSAYTPPTDPTAPETDLWNALVTQANAASKAAACHDIESRADALITQAVSRLLAIGSDCDALKTEVRGQVDELFTSARGRLTKLVIPPVSLIAIAVPAVESVRDGLTQHEKTIVTAFAAIRADLVRLRDSSRGDLAVYRNAAATQVRHAQDQIDAFLNSITDQIDGVRKRITSASRTVNDGSAALCITVLADIQKALDDFTTAVGANPPLLDGAKQHLATARTQLARVLTNATIGDIAGKLLGLVATAETALSGLEAFEAAAVQTFAEALKKGGQALASSIGAIAMELTDALSAVGGAFDTLTQRRKDIRQRLDNISKAWGDTIRNLDSLFDELLGVLDAFCWPLETALDARERTVIGSWRKGVADGFIAVSADAVVVDARLNVCVAWGVSLATEGAALLNAAIDPAKDWLGVAQIRAIGAIDAINCVFIASTVAVMEETVRGALRSAENEIRDRVTGLASDLLDEGTRCQLQSIEQHLADANAKLLEPRALVGNGIKLIKSVGELPALPTLTFNAARAEYVFDDLQKQIETSPFAAKLREIDAGMKELGLAVPARKLLDQIIPDSLKDIDFNKIFRNFGGIDFKDLFKRFQLPQLENDQIRITHGVDRSSRSAWVKTRVDVDHDSEQTLFEFAGIALQIARLKLHALSDMSIAANGEKRSTTDARFTGDWGLDFGGTRLATFREVTVRYDGSRFDFDLSPNKIDLHPAISFVSEFAKRFTPDLPPAVELVKDSRGVPVGARASFVNELTLPSLGAIEIGPLLIATGLSLQVGSAGQFLIASKVSVGSQKAPVWIQIGYLGGGLWLEAQATYEGTCTYSATLGLAIGSARTLNVSGVARGSYSLLLFAYAEFSNAGGSMRAGFSMAGSARILGIANASVYLLLEVSYRSGGDAQGHGLLDVSIDICWCYSIHVRKEVQQKIGG